MADLWAVTTSATPVLFDKALEQTRQMGFKYAVIPLPWLIEWANNIDLIERFVPSEKQFKWWEVCLTKGKQLWHSLQPEDAALIDGDGNVMLCLLEPEHEGDCGFYAIERV